MGCLGGGRLTRSRQLISRDTYLAVYSFSEEAAETKSAYFATCLTQSGPGNKFRPSRPGECFGWQGPQQNHGSVETMARIANSRAHTTAAARTAWAVTDVLVQTVGSERGSELVHAGASNLGPGIRDFASRTNRQEL